MADAYDVNGVTVTPAAGGYYDITHQSLPDGTERVQGKERADQRATEIADAAKGDDSGRMEAQGTITDGQKANAPKMPDITTDGTVQGSSDHRSAAEKRQETDAVYQGRMDNTLPGNQREVSTDPQARDAEMDELRRQLNEANDRLDKMNDAGRKVASVTAEPPAPSAIPSGISRRYAGQMADEDKRALKEAGIDVRTIVLEENDSIPPTGLFIGHNGRSYIIKPGEEVDVPSFLTDVLDDAVMSAPVVDASTQKILGYRNRSKYPYRVVKG